MMYDTQKEKDIDDSLCKPTYDDRIAELEAVILRYYLDKGYRIEKDKVHGDVKWGFSVSVHTAYKQKALWVNFYKNEDESSVYMSEMCSTTKEMFDKAIEFFGGGQS